MSTTGKRMTRNDTMRIKTKRSGTGRSRAERNGTKRNDATARGRATRIAMLLICLHAIAGCAIAGNGARNTVEDGVTIGVYTVLEGEGASIGQATMKGMELAQEELAAEGIAMRFDVQDTQLEPQRAVGVVKRFIDLNGYELIISAEGSGATIASAPLAEEARKVLMIALASAPELRDAGDYVFRVTPSDAYQGGVMADKAQALGVRQAAILRLNDAYGAGIERVFIEESGLETFVETFETGAGDYRSQLIRLERHDPDLLIVIARDEFPTIMRQKEELGITTPAIASETVHNEQLIATAGAAARGTLIPFYEGTDERFLARYRERYGEEAGAYSAFGYDAVRALGEAIKTADSAEAEKVRAALHDVEFDGASGHVAFDEQGEVSGKEFVWYRVEGGQLVEEES